MFCAPGLVFGGTEGVGSLFHVLLFRTRFRRYRVRRVPFSCLAHPDSFSTVPSASGPVFMFGAPGLVFDGAEFVGSRFHILPARTHFWRYGVRRLPFTCFSRPDSIRRYRGRHVPFSCFARSETFSAVARASGPVFMFCAPGHIFDGTDGVGSRFHVLSSRSRFRRCRVCRVSFSCSARPDSF
jgi:hypothetical protein